MTTYFDIHQKQLLEELCTFLKFETISADPTKKQEMEACVCWLQNFLSEAGFEVSIWPTPSNPTVFATSKEPDPNKPTLLIYAHYDVQPVDPLDMWDSPPFEPTIREGNIYARGAMDDKGQCFFVLGALRAYYQKHQSYPINLKVLIEGDEETGSRGLQAVLEEKKEVLQADACAIADLGIGAIDRPSITLGVRGILTCDLTVMGPKGDLHSGTEGGVIQNPNQALVEILASFKDESGKVLIERFYDNVLPLANAELFDFTFDAKSHFDQHGVEPHGGETNFSPKERAWIRPTLEINGLTGGYAGVGFKTVIPAKACAKISCRLVPGQTPLEIEKLIQQHVEKVTPKGVTASLHFHEGAGEAARANPSSFIIEALKQAYESVFDLPCTFTLEGGSIPISVNLAKAANAELAFFGLGLPTDQIHAPNEHFGLDRLKMGFSLIEKLLEVMQGIKFDSSQ